MHKVVSSNVEEIGWKDSVLAVRFKKGNLYHYEPVSQSTFQELLHSESVGRALRTEVIGKSEITCIKKEDGFRTIAKKTGGIK